MILAAGRGTRMRPLSDHTHKGLLKIAGETLLERHLKRLAAIGIRDVVINVSYLADQIQNYLGNGQQFGVTIHYSIEKSALEVGGGLINALPLLGKEPFIVVNCDVWTDYPFQKLTHVLENKMNENNSEEHKLGHLILVNNPAHNAQGDFHLANNHKVELIDPALQSNGDTTKNYTYAGIAVYHPKLFQQYKTASAQAMLPILKDAIMKEQITGEFYNGLWSDIGTPDRLAAIQG